MGIISSFLAALLIYIEICNILLEYKTDSHDPEKAAVVTPSEDHACLVR